jgi:hypothetical protein
VGAAKPHRGGSTRGGLGGLRRIAETLRKDQRSGALFEAALEIAGALPEDAARDLRVGLQSGHPSAARR